MTINSRPIPGLLLADHRITVPLDHAHPDAGTLEVYGREVRAIEHAEDDLPWLVFLQGGPGSPSPRPRRRDGWLAEAVKDYRVLLLDQRGTGRSTPVTDRTPARFADGAALADYLALFRADSIVRDLELLRGELAGEARWTTLGQSYGGWCTFTYLSIAPEGLDKCLIAGGLPGLDATPDDVYRRTWSRVIDKNAEHVRRFPEDAATLNRIRDLITARPADHPIRLPGGDLLSVERLQRLGLVFGMSYGFAQVHYLLEDAFDADELASTFLHQLERHTTHVHAPLYAALQEIMYCAGTAPRWAADRIQQEFPATLPDAPQLLLTGEMKGAQIFREEAAMTPFAEAMELLNARSDWPALFDAGVLAHNPVPVAAAIYFDDMYVDASLSLDTARRVPNVRPWVTNEYEHDGLRTGSVFRRLHDLAIGAT